MRGLRRAALSCSEKYNINSSIDIHSTCLGTENSFKRDFRRCRRHSDVVPEERAVCAVRFLFDGHGEFLQTLRLEAALPQHTRKLSGESTFMAVTGEERDRLAALPSAPYKNVNVNSRRRRSRYAPVRPIRWM